jgi:chromosome segregation ATPase
MTDAQKKTLTEFEARVRQLMFMYETLKLENAALEQQISEKNEKLRLASEEMKSLKAKYDNLKMARIIAVRQDDFKGAKQRLSKLVREVEKCIALLNE